MSTILTIPDQIYHINYGAFYNVGGFSTLVLNSSIKTIGSYAFGYCNSLSNVLYNCSTIPQLKSYNAFEGVNNNLAIYVPYSLVEGFKTAGGWSY